MYWSSVFSVYISDLSERASYIQVFCAKYKDLGKIHLFKQPEATFQSPILKSQGRQMILRNISYSDIILLGMQKDIKGIDDLCHLEDLNEESILDCLTTRYKEDHIFTSIGQTLLALNPYKYIPQLFEQQKLDTFKDKLVRGAPHRQPHIYGVAGRAYQGMLNKQKKQSIIISGQSGAGKTQSAKYCLKMLTHLSQQQARGQDHLIEQKLLACNPILQAFGNSKTVRNDNSSRFGKYLQIYFDAKQTVRGANIRSYLLEKTRVTYVASEERNFHIFYALCAYMKKSPKDYHFLRQSNCLTISGKQDRQSYEQIRKCMDDLCFPKSYQQKIQRLLVAILQLGNLQFEDNDHERDVNVPCKVKNSQMLMEISKTLQCDSAALVESLVINRLQMPKQVILKSLDKAQCIMNRNTLCKAIYNCIFQSVISKMNEAMTPDRSFEVSYRLSSASMLSKEPIINSTFEINILDIFGFENFDENSLEQLCINYTNEKLLNIYNKSVFQNELQQLREDYIDVDQLTPPTAQPKIALLEEVFKIIKQKTLIKQFKDEDIINAFRTNRENSSHIRSIQYDKQNNQKFLIRHSPVDIKYSVVGFKSKNQDRVSEDIQNIYSHLFPQLSNSQQARTLLQKFTVDIKTLVQELQSAQNYYVRCIKPNDRKRNEVDCDFMKRQIRYLGVFQTIKIRKSVYPFRKTYEDFYHIYQDIFKKKGTQCSSRQKSQSILREIGASPEMYLLGHRRIYLSTELQEKLNAKVIDFQKLKKAMVSKIIKAFRKMRCKQKLRIVIKKVIVNIKTLRKWGERMETYRKQLLFHGFTLLRQQSQKENEIIMRELIESIEQLNMSQISRVQGEENHNVFQTICRLKSLKQSRFFREFENVLPQNEENNHNKEEIKSLREEISQLKMEVTQLNIKITSQENQISRLEIEKSQAQDKVIVKEREVKGLEQLNNRYCQQMKEIKQRYSEGIEMKKELEQKLQMQKQKHLMLVERLEQVQKQNIEINRNFNSRLILNESTLSVQQSLQMKMKQIAGLKSELINKELMISELREKESTLKVQNQDLKKNLKEMEQHLFSKSKKQEEKTQKVKTLQEIIISLQKAQEDYKKQNHQLFRTKQEVNQKCYQKIKELQQARNKIREYESKQKTKDYNKEALDRALLKVNFLDNENEKMKKSLKQMEFELVQQRNLSQRLREKIGEAQQRGNNNHIQVGQVNETKLSERQILQQLNSLKATLSNNHRSMLLQKIVICLS